MFHKMDKKIVKKYFLSLALVFFCFAIISCRKNIIIHEAVLMDESATGSDVFGFIQTSILNWSFALWLLAYILTAIFLWKNGYSSLKWFKGRHLSNKVVIILLFLGVLYVLGCIPQQNYGGWFAIPVMAVLWSSFVVISAIIKRYRYRIKSGNTKDSLPESVHHRRNLHLLGRVIIWVWSCGWLLYFVAIGIAKGSHVGAEVLWRSAIASLNLFLTNIDSTIIGDIQGHDVLKGMISCVGLSAVICTILLILSLILYRLMSYLHIRHIQIDNERNHLYVFFGINDASRLLADSIYDGDPHSVIVFVESLQYSNSEQEEEKIDGWKTLVSLLIHRRKAFLDADENERRALTISSCDICCLRESPKDVLGNIGVEPVKRLIEGLKVVNDAQLHVFFLSEDRDTNVQSTAILAKDDLIGSEAFQTVIYCHARRNTINRIVEDLGLDPKRKTDVRIIDSSYLAIEQLKRNVKNHPVSYVDVKKLDEDNPGSVSSEFVSLVMGFGETGQEAVEFLYEYGAFVHKDATPDNSKRSPFICYVLDNDMKKLEGHFIADTPGVKYKKCNPYRNCKFEANQPNETNATEEVRIELYPFDYRSDEFFTEILKDEIVQKLNYVVVAIGDDEQNMTAAVEILRYVRKKRENLDNFCIYVRAYEKGTFKYLTDIADHYNKRLWKEDNDNVKKIVLFGQNEQIYTYELVVKDKYQEEGKKYYETYRSLHIDPNPDNDEGTWEERHNDILKNRKITKWERKSKIRRKESQDRSNALHAHTKIKLLQETVGKENAKDFALKALEYRTGRQSSITYPLLSSAENKLMLNLAMCEHLRWNAAHEMMGYVNNENGHKCDERTRQHNCLKPWQDLDKESDAVDYIDDYKVFDFGVVETSFKLFYGV